MAPAISFIFIFCNTCGVQMTAVCSRNM